ncbi:MAG: esterase family protein [Paludibacteraceae bacterium]|nr:esterase family protein [Paludibacteraceae bacterium]
MKKIISLLFVVVFAISASSKQPVPVAISEEEHNTAISHNSQIAHGTVLYPWYFSKTLNGYRRMAVYLPPSYFSSNKNYYPVLYLIHGTFGEEQDWIEKGCTANIIDHLLALGQASEMIIVMPNTNMWQMASEKITGIEDPYKDITSASEHLTDGVFEESFSEIISFTERNFRTITRKDSRAIAGLSRGGFFAMHISHYLNSLFDYVGLFSPTYTTSANRMGKEGDLFVANRTTPKVYKNVEKDLKRQFQNPPELYWIAIGKQDFLYGENITYRKFLDKNHYPYQYYESDGGHSWTNWQYYLQMFLPCLF